MVVGIISWMNDNNGFIMGVLTLVYVVATWKILNANKKSVEEMVKTREEENRPYIIAYFDVNPNNIVRFVVKNIGKTMAYNVKIESDVPFEYPLGHPLKLSNIFTKPIPNMPPDFVLNPYMDTLVDIKNEDGDYPVYNIDIKYSDKDGKKTYKDRYVLDLNVHKDLFNWDIKNIHHLAKSFESFRKETKSQLASISDSLKNSD